VERLETDPASMFLPIGTVVRFTDAPTYANSLGYSDVGKAYPVPGSIGVVTGLEHGAEWPINVSLRRPFKCGYGDQYEPDYDRVPTFRVDPDKVEVVEPGMLPGGRPCESYGYVATHARTEGSFVLDEKDEMIIEADGFFWRFAAFDDGRLEAMQAYERIEEMTWVAGPLEPEADEPEAPSPGPR